MSTYRGRRWGQITLFSGPERQRRWSNEQRLQILTEALAPGTCPTNVARRHEISTGHLYTWRSKLEVDAPPGPDDGHGLGFAEAAVTPPGARVWIAMGHTDMRKGMQGLTLIVQQALSRRRSRRRPRHVDPDRQAQ